MRDPLGIDAGQPGIRIRYARFRDMPGSRSGRLFAALFVTATLLICTPVPCLAEPIDEYNLALQLYKQERWAQAATQFDKFLQQAPGHEKAALAKLYLGQSLIRVREFQKARSIFREFVQTHPNHPDVNLAIYRIAECSYFLDDFPTARKELREFLAKVPPDHALNEWALQYLGETELRLGNVQDAATAFEQLLKQFAKGQLAGEAKYGLARAYARLDRSAEAAAIYRELAADSANPRAADALFGIASTAFDAKQYADAAAAFESLVERFPKHELVPLATLNAGFSRYHLGDHQQAQKLFNAVAADPKHGKTARYWTGLSRKSQGQFAEASELLLKLYQEDKQQPLAENVLFHAADSKLGAKEYAESRALFRELLDRFPEGQFADDALYSSMEAALMSGDFEEAETLHRQFSTTFPDSGLTQASELLLGRVLLARGDQLIAQGTDASREQGRESFRRAADALQRIVNTSQLAKTQDLARLQLARAWDRLGNQERVTETLAPLVAAARTPDATDEQLRALVMQSTSWLARQDYAQSIRDAEQYLARRPTGGDAADALANICVAQAKQGDWDASLDTLGRLKLESENLAERITYEVAEAAYAARQWDTAQALYEQVRAFGPQSEFYLPAISGLAYSLHEAGRAMLAASEASAKGGDATDGTSQFSEAIRLFDAAAQRFQELEDLATERQDRKVQSSAAYLRGLSLKLARRLQPASEILLQTAETFALPPDTTEPTAEQLAVADNAYRSAKEAARALVELEQIEQADSAYENAYQIIQRLPETRSKELDLLINEWALLHYNAEQFERSDELFQRLLEETPDSAWADDARLLLAESDFFSERFDAARDGFRAIVADPKTDDFVRQRALLLLVDSAAALNDWAAVAESAKSLGELLEQKSPDSADRAYAEYRLGESALRLGSEEEAASRLQKLLDERRATEVANAEWFPNVWLMLAEAKLRLKDYVAVDQVVADFKEQHPESPFTYLLDDVQGRRFKNDGRFEEARQAFQRIIDSRDGHGTETAAKAQFLIAEILLAQANVIRDNAEDRKQAYEDAFLAYFRVLQYSFPQWRAPALLMSGKCDEALERWTGAKKSYHQLIAEHPDSEFAGQARERLADLERRFPSAAP